MKKNKQSTNLMAIFMVLLLPLFVFAQTTEQSLLTEIINLIGGWKGLSSFAAALAVVQLLVKFLSDEKLSGGLLKKVSPEIKFLIIQFLSIIVAYLTLVVSGVSGVEAVFKTLAMPVFVEFLHKLYKQFIEKKDVSV